MRVRIAIVLLFACLLVGCSPGGSSSDLKLVLPTALPTQDTRPTQPPAPTVTATEIPTPVAPPTLAIDTSAIKRQLAQVQADAAKMRGLKPKRPVPEHFVSQEEMKYDLTQQTLHDYTYEMARRDVTRLWLLMFIDDPTMDFRQMEIEFSGQAVLGYYDQNAKELFVRTDGPTLSPASKETLAHEFVHNLQDQYFDLKKMLPPDIDHDRQEAVRALVEGDATVSGLLYASLYMSRGDFRKIFQSDNLAPPVPGRAPVYLQEGWQFPYKYGSEFVLSLAEPGNYRPIDAAFADPPVSTEQIMHPEKYLESPRDNPLPVALPALTDTLGAGWKFVESDTLGEFDLQVMLRENYIEQPEASEGWGGARYALYENGNSALAIMGSRWDTKGDAAEFQDALEQSFKLFQKYDTLWHDSKRVWGLTKSGDMVVFVSGTDLATVQRVMATIK